MGERFRTRSLVVSRAFARRSVRSDAPGCVRTALVAHNLLLGDTLMLTGLVKKLASQGIEVTLLASYHESVAQRRADQLTEARAAAVKSAPGRS